ncbi:MAG: NlpC/P60 family protein [Gemmatimonadetes bacterium]|nr:NlpC/P60 family protein [Gemmatimonadota bacterium]
MARGRSFRLALALAATTATGSLAQGKPDLAAPAKPFEALSRTLLAGRDSLVQLTKQQVGLKYRYGASEPGRAFDCSALVQWIAGLFGREMPRTAAQQALTGLPVAKDTTQLLPGDLLFFGKGRRVDHIGIYVGEGKYVHAANKRKGVIESDVSRLKARYWKGVRRIFLEADSVLSEVSPTAPES